MTNVKQKSCSERNKIEWLFEGKWAGLSLVRILTSFLSTSEIEGRLRRRRKEFMSHRSRPDERKSENPLTTNPLDCCAGKLKVLNLSIDLKIELFLLLQ